MTSAHDIKPTIRAMLELHLDRRRAVLDELVISADRAEFNGDPHRAAQLRRARNLADPRVCP